MQHFLSQPYRLIWWSIPAVLVLSILGTDRTIDLQMHDTYFVIAAVHFGIASSISLGIIGLGYWLLRDVKLVPWMTAVHVINTILACALIIALCLSFKNLIELELGGFGKINRVFMIIILAASLSQLVFLMNIIRSLVKDRRQN